MAEEIGAPAIIAKIDSLRGILFRKAGDHRKLLELNGNQEEENEFRIKLAADKTKEIEDVSRSIKQHTASRLHDGIEDSLDPFFVFNALCADDGSCKDFGRAYTNRAATRMLEESTFEVFLYSEANLLPQLAGLGEALDKAVGERTSFEDVHEVEIEGARKFWQRRVGSKWNWSSL